jgi:hypothetical protein
LLLFRGRSVTSAIAHAQAVVEHHTLPRRAGRRDGRRDWACWPTTITGSRLEVGRECFDRRQPVRHEVVGRYTGWPLADADIRLDAIDAAGEKNASSSAWRRCRRFALLSGMTVKLRAG